MGKAGGLSLRSFAFAVTTVLVSAIGVLGIAAPAQAYGESTILALVNKDRAANGRGPLKLNSAMNAVALAWANQMAANGAMTHNPNYSSQIPGGWSRAAENVAQGFGSPTAVHNGWMNSSGHRANILGDYTDIGIAFIEANGTTWAVENFAKYGASVPPPNPPDPPSPSPSPSPSPLVTPTPSPSPSASTPSSPPGSNPQRLKIQSRAALEASPILPLPLIRLLLRMIPVPIRKMGPPQKHPRQNRLRVAQARTRK
ncbi:MAG: CAP domain-containing protein [Homoserinimonas sp.]|nr:CAP domain-containing protein [Homoserinimonas sp.]